MYFLIWVFSSKFYCRMEIIQRLFTMLPNENISSIYLHQIIGICHEKSWIMRFKLCFYCGSMFLDFFLKVSKFKSIIFQYYFRKFFQGITLDLLVMLSLEQEHSQFVCVCFFFVFWGVGGEGAVVSFLPNPHLNFQTKKGPTASVFWNIRDIAFYRCFEILRTRNVTYFTVCATVFGQFTHHFIFSNFIGVTDYFTMDLLKNVRQLALDLLNNFLLWTIRKKTLIKESLNFRLWGKSWTYWKKSSKTREASI